MGLAGWGQAFPGSSQELRQQKTRVNACLRPAVLARQSCVGVTAAVAAPAAGLPLQDAVKVMAKSLVRNRHAVNKLFQLKSQLQAVSLRIAVRGRGDGRSCRAGAGSGPCAAACGTLLRYDACRRPQPAALLAPA